MVIGVLTTSYPRGPDDPAGSFVADRVDALVRAGHTVEVLAGGRGSGGGEGEGDASVVPGPGVTVTRLPSRFGDGPDLFGGAGAPEALEEGRVATVLAAARFSAALAAAAGARAPRWSRVESHWLAPSALAAMAGAPALPHRAYAHSGDVALLERLPFGRTLAACLAASGADLVFVSAALRARFARLGGRAVGTVETLQVPSGLFVRRAQADRRLRAALGLDGRGPVVLSVGRLVPIKGYDLLIRACARHAGRIPLTLVLLGAGPERARLSALARRMGVTLRLPGRLPRQRVADHLQAADVYAQPSRALPNGRTEGLPVATLEALSVGVPVIASDCGGLAELSGLHPGLSSFRAGDVAALATALAERIDLSVTCS